MIIAHIITHFDLGGAERVAANIAKSKTSGFEYHIFEVQRSNGEFRKQFIQELRQYGINVHESYVPYSKLAIILFPFWFIFSVIKVKPDVIHSHTEIPDLALYLWYSVFGYFFNKIKIVRTIHNTELWNDWRRIGDFVEKLFIKHNSNVAISEAVRSDYIEKYGNSPTLIYNGLDVPSQKKFEGIVDGKINILFAGRFTFQKGVDELIKVIYSLKYDVRYFFHIIGSGELSDKFDQSLMNCHNYKRYDKIFGLSSYLSSFDYLFMPSNFEGLGLMSVEASLVKLPSIINKCPGLNETLPEAWPLAVKNNSIEEYLKIFADIDKVDRTMLGNIAHDFVQHRFSIEKMQMEYERIYKLVVDHKLYK